LLRPVIEREAIAWAVASIDNHGIDEINILNASFLAMHRAVAQLKVIPEFLLIDGNRFKTDLPYAYRTIVRGDSASFSIACASVVAKVTRDRLMHEADEKYPLYGFAKHKGYGTKFHIERLREHGPCEIHRKSFEPVRISWKRS
jgi:ribonuclease HII